MTKITIGKNQASRSHEANSGGCVKPQPGSGNFARALKSGTSGQATKPVSAKSALPATGSSGKAAGKSHAGGLPTYQSTKVMSLNDLVGKFRQMDGQIQQIISGCGIKSVPSIAVMDMKSGGAMRHIGNTIFVDQICYNEWKAGSDDTGFEADMCQMVSAALSKLH